MHLGGLLSHTRRYYTSFVLSNLLRASITPWLHAACLPFLNYNKAYKKAVGWEKGVGEYNRSPFPPFPNSHPMSKCKLQDTKKEGYCLLSINNVELSIANGETAPPYHPVSRSDTPPQNKQFKYKNHAWTDVRLRWTHCEHTLINLKKHVKISVSKQK